MGFGSCCFLPCWGGLTGGCQMCWVEGMEIEIEQESDGRWIAEIPALPGAMAYGVSRKDAVETVKALALRMMARITRRTGLTPSDV